MFLLVKAPSHFVVYGVYALSGVAHIHLGYLLLKFLLKFGLDALYAGSRKVCIVYYALAHKRRCVLLHVSLDLNLAVKPLCAGHSHNLR